MPAYDYRCQSCKNVFEKTQRISEPAGADCPQCGSAQCERIITGGTFHLKGSGWYASDYGGKAAAPAESAAPKAAESASAPAGGCGAGACGSGACAAGDVS